jgi:poly(ADP-ribose) glycohydrolase
MIVASDQQETDSSLEGQTLVCDGISMECIKHEDDQLRLRRPDGKAIWRAVSDVQTLEQHAELLLSQQTADSALTQAVAVVFLTGAKWSAVADAMEQPTTSPDQLAEVISHNRRISGLSSLHTPRVVQMVDSHASPDFFETVAWVKAVALRLPELFADGLAMLVQDCSNSIQLTKLQVFALLSAGFLGLLPLQQESTGEMPRFDFGNLICSDDAKFSCLVTYFSTAARVVQGQAGAEIISFERICLSEQTELLNPDFWAACELPLSEMSVVEPGAIELAHGTLQADFANEFIGGGVLHGGNVQEEIRFSICPEMLVSMLFCERMKDLEAVVIVGAQQFSQYSGYGGSFTCEGPASPDSNALDAQGRRDIHLVAIDALCYPGDLQYEPAGMVRELVKASAGFQGDQHEAGGALRAVATGNWGSGVFGGDPQLKCLLQWMAATVAGRAVIHFPYGDQRMSTFASILLLFEGKRVKDVWKLLCDTHATTNGRQMSTNWKYEFGNFTSN